MAKEYLWVDEIAQKWGISKSWVYRLCRQGRVNGAFFLEGRWSVPKDAEKPLPRRSKRIKMLQSRRISLPMAFPLKFEGEPDDIPTLTERLFSDCAEYVINYVDMAPGSGRTLFCALSYPHINAAVVCQNRLEYAFLSALKNNPSELCSAASIMLFEYSACQTGERRKYFEKMLACVNELYEGEDDLKYASVAVFISQTASGGEIAFDRENGQLRASQGRKKTNLSLDIKDFLLFSSLLERAVIYPSAENAKENMTFPEYSALHISREQYEGGECEEATAQAERIFVLD